MSRKERGIFGIRKDSAVKIFSFSGEDWPSSDSEDSDYCPSEDNKAPSKLKSKVYSNNSKLLAQRKHSSPSTRSEDPQAKKFKTDESFLFQHIPFVILRKIFHYVIDEEGVYPFLWRAAKVCTWWKDVCSDPNLWHEVDLSHHEAVNKTHLLSNCQEHLFNVRYLNFSGWTDLKDASLNIVSENCPNLIGINLSLCKKITFTPINNILENCGKLSNIDLSYVTRAVNPKNLKIILSSMNSRLTHLSLNGTHVGNMNSLIHLLTQYSPNLIELNLSHVSLSSVHQSFNIEILQNFCPKLTCIQLINTPFIVAMPNSKQIKDTKSLGFPELRSLLLSMNVECLGRVNDEILYKFLITSKKLQVLDISGSNSVTVSGLLTLPVENLKSLFLRSTSVSRCPELYLVFQKWKHSLLEVDLSWNSHTSEVLDFALMELVKDSCKSQLISLDLSGSAVSFKIIKALLENSPNLTYLNLSSCRYLPRGIKRKYEEEDIKKLRNDIMKGTVQDL